MALMELEWPVAAAGGGLPAGHAHEQHPTPGAESPSRPLQHHRSALGGGLLDALPDHVLLTVLKLLDVRALAACAMVCRRLRALVADADDLWDALLRAELGPQAETLRAASGRRASARPRGRHVPAAGGKWGGSQTNIG